jgi:hypothetical protein
LWLFPQEEATLRTSSTARVWESFSNNPDFGGGVPRTRPPLFLKTGTGYTKGVMATEKTFYLETFGCQMNAHDSEKVIGTLEQQGYTRVDSEQEAGLILYNTCSIRDKAEQKVFNRLNDYKALRKQGKRFGVLGCVAQQEGEKIFDRVPPVPRPTTGCPRCLCSSKQARRALPDSMTVRPARPSRPS